MNGESHAALCAGAAGAFVTGADAGWGAGGGAGGGATCTGRAGAQYCWRGGAGAGVAVAVAVAVATTGAVATDDAEGAITVPGVVSTAGGAEGRVTSASGPPCDDAASPRS